PSDGLFPLHPGSGVMGQLGRVPEVELSLYLLAVILDGLDAQMQFLGDLAGLFPLADELEDLQFAVAQPLNGRFLDALLPADLLIDELGDAVADHRMVVHQQDTRPVVSGLRFPGLTVPRWNLFCQGHDRPYEFPVLSRALSATPPTWPPV